MAKNDGKAGSQAALHQYNANNQQPGNKRQTNMFTQGATGANQRKPQQNNQLGATYNNNEFAPAVNKGTAQVLDKPVGNDLKQEDRHPQDKVLEYLKDGQPAEDEFCT